MPFSFLLLQLKSWCLFFKFLTNIDKLPCRKYIRVPVLLRIPLTTWVSILSGKRNFILICISFEASLVAQLIKNPPAIQETLVQFLGWEDLMEKGQATYSSIPWASLVVQLVKNPPAKKKKKNPRATWET